MSSWHSLKATNDAQSELIASEQEKVSSLLLIHSSCVCLYSIESCARLSVH